MDRGDGIKLFSFLCLLVGTCLLLFLVGLLVSGGGFQIGGIGFEDDSSLWGSIYIYDAPKRRERSVFLVELGAVTEQFIVLNKYPAAKQGTLWISRFPYVASIYISFATCRFQRK